MAVLVTKPAPDFTADAVLKDGSFGSLTLSQLKGKYVLLFFYPLDFTFVCPTEIIAFSDRVKEFNDLGVEVVGVSIDSKFSHLAWRNLPRSEGGIGAVNYTLVADIKKQISRDYDVLLDDAVALRGLFLIDKAGVSDTKSSMTCLSDAPSMKPSEWSKPSNTSKPTAKSAQPTGKKENEPSNLAFLLAKNSSELNTKANSNKPQ